SMFFTLLVVPVIFVAVKSRTTKNEACKHGTAVAAVIMACVLFAGGKEASAEPVKQSLTLSQAVELALKQNSVLKISRLKVTENDQRIVSVRAQYFPLLSNNTKLLALSNKQLVTIPAG